uniref:Uncharacterized protein n=1 Tax=Rhizophora mucronata TaxID=61149 RepID=A0A2P2JBC1_RHIMU
MDSELRATNFKSVTLVSPATCIIYICCYFLLYP